MRASIASLAVFLAVSACTGAPSERPPQPAARPRAQPTATAAVAPSPCEEAGALLASARAALDEGRILRARRSIQQASTRCPARTAEALPLELRAAALLNDVAEMARLKATAAGAPSSNDLQEALAANESPFGGDVPAGVAPSSNTADYYRAARAFVDGKLDEAGRGAMSFAFSGSGPLLKEAFLLAARVAEASGDMARANRMFARAFLAACSSGCDAPAKPPSDDLFSLAATYPGFRLAGRHCVVLHEKVSLADPSHQALTPDGRFHVMLVGSGAEIRAVPERVLVGYIKHESGVQSTLACFSERALFTLIHRYDQRDRVFVGLLGGELRAVKGPHRLWIADGFRPGRPLPLVTTSGVAYVPEALDWHGAREWYRAGPGDRALKPFPTPIKHFEPGLLPNGDIVGFDKRVKDQDEPLAIFNGTTGKRLRVLGPAPDGFYFVVSADGTQLVYDLWYDDDGHYGLVDLSKEGPRAELGAAAPSPKDFTERLRFAKAPKKSILEGIVDPSRLIVVDEDNQFAILNLTQGTFEPAGITAGPIRRAEVRGGRLLVQIADSVVAHRLSDGQMSRDQAGVSFEVSLKPKASAWDHMKLRPRCEEKSVVTGESGAYLYQCSDNSIWRDHPDTQAPATRLGELPPVAWGAELKSWDELMIGEILDKRAEALRIRFAQGAKGGIAVDGKGYFEFFGEVPDAFRKASVCGETMPIEACADLYETPGMARMFLARDFSYRAP